MDKEHEGITQAFIEGHKLLQEELIPEQHEKLTEEGNYQYCISFSINYMYIFEFVQIFLFSQPKPFSFISEYLTEEDLEYYVHEDCDEEESRTRESAMVAQQEI